MIQLLLISHLFESIVSIRSPRCLPPETLLPCKCSIHYSRIEITCNNVAENHLIKLNSHFTKRANILKYKITQSTLSYINKETFNNLDVSIFEIENSQVIDFELFGGFKGMEKALDTIVITNVTVINWIFSSAQNFGKLRHFEIKMSKGKEIPVDDFILCLPDGIEDIIFEHFTVNSTENFNFQRFQDLETLSLKSGGLKSMNRTYLPFPAEELETLDLSHNPITALPDDMFSEMPDLKDLSLYGTLLTTLHYHIFEPIYNQLIFFYISDNLICDCEASWLLLDDSPLDKYYVCRNPPSLNDRFLSDLLPIELCFNCEEIGEMKTPILPETSTTDTLLENNKKEVLSETDEIHHTTWGAIAGSVTTSDSRNTTV